MDDVLDLSLALWFKDLQSCPPGCQLPVSTHCLILKTFLPLLILLHDYLLNNPSRILWFCSPTPFFPSKAFTVMHHLMAWMLSENSIVR